MMLKEFYQDTKEVIFFDPDKYSGDFAEKEKDIFNYRIKFATYVLAVPLVLSFFAVDLVYAFNEAESLFLIRSFVFPVIFLMIILDRYQIGKTSLYWLQAMIIVSFLSIYNCFLIQYTGGSKSFYFAGLMLTVMGSVSFFPLPLYKLFMIILLGIVPFATMIPFLSRDFSSSSYLVALSFLSSTAAIGLFIAIVSRNQRLKLFVKAEEEKETLERLSHRERELSQNQQIYSLGMAGYGLAHEIGNHLNIISTGVDILKDNIEIKEKDKDVFNKVITKMNKGILRSAKIIEDFHKSSRLRDEVIPFKLDDLIDSVLTFMKGYTKETIRVEFERKEDLYVVFNESHVYQAVLNVIKNACEALKSTKNPNIIIRYYLDQSGIGIIIEDNGPGVAQEHVERVFENRFTTKATGNGVGLFMMRSNLKKGGGDIVLSKPTDPTTFIIKIPRRKENETNLAS